jgi:hypothetical protein
MAKLKAAARNALPASSFGLPGAKGRGNAKGKYPMPDKAHARVAKSYASKETNAGKLSKAQEGKIDAKANRVLGRGMVKK